MIRTQCKTMPGIVQELKWALMLEADEAMLRESKEGREIRKQLKRLEKGTKKICRVCDKIDPDVELKNWHKELNRPLKKLVMMMIAELAINWAFACGISWLISLCFGWDFSWAGATGLWLLWLVSRIIFNKR